MRKLVLGMALATTALKERMTKDGFDPTPSTPEQAAAIAKVADGVVVGSALVEICGEHGADAPKHLKTLTAALAEAVHNAR